jgi:hypothetical protein
MSSQLNVDTIVDKAGSGGTNVKVANTSTYVSDEGGATQNTVQGIAKHWTLHNDGSIMDSYNLSALTDNGTGDFTHAFSNSFNSLGRYSVSGVAQDIDTKNAQINYMSGNASLDAASIRYQTGFVANTSGAQTNHDCNSTSMTIHGDLA